MGCFGCFKKLAALCFGIYLSFVICPCDKQQPYVDVGDGWWGRGNRQPDKDITIHDFKINVSDDVLKDLRVRLDNIRYGEDLENVEFQYGFQVGYMKEVVQYWRDSFNWRKQENILNKFRHYKTRIEGIDVHFIRALPENPGKSTRPLLMVHGWPGSVWEFYKLIPQLTQPTRYGFTEDDGFEVICPSIPGYGFSEAPHQEGFDTSDAARVFVKLMERLGHDKFYVQGGDWGGVITTLIAGVYPQKVLGAHLNMYPPNPAPSLVSIAKQILGGVFPSLVGLTEAEHKLMYPLSKTFANVLYQTGYMHLQATKPDTVAFALNDSPVGLAAYILEKFSSWTELKNYEHKDGGLTRKFTLDELLTNVMIYWTTGSIGSSMRLYKESLGMKNPEIYEWFRPQVTVPSALILFPEELFPMPKAFVTHHFINVVQYTIMSHGGHFATLENPDVMAKDIVSFVHKVELIEKQTMGKKLSEL